MWLKSISKKHIIDVLIGVYIAAVLWITLMSRVGTGYRAFLLPFQSYGDVFSGNWGALIENVENVILFIPLGMILGALKKLRWKKALLIALGVSLSIELLQTIFALGTFEFDDLIHNSLGAMAGYWITEKIEVYFEIRIKQIKLIVATVLIGLVFPLSLQGFHFCKMVQIAALHNRDDGAENLLVLKGKDGYASETDVYVKYFKDGSISIKGASNKKSWFLIGKIKLEAGKYTFSGLSHVDKNTVGLVLENDGHRIIDDVGPVNEIQFELKEKTELAAYVIVYTGCNCDVVATPVIYREG